MVGFGRKLLLFLMVDAVLAMVEVAWQRRPFAAVLALVLLRCPYSFIIAAIWNVTDKRRSPCPGSGRNNVASEFRH